MDAKQKEGDDIAVAMIRAQISGARAERCEAHFTSFQMEAVLRQLDAAEARAEGAEAYARDAEQAAARACMELFVRRHADPRPDFGEVGDGR